jgi:hypothetical protein
MQLWSGYSGCAAGERDAEAYFYCAAVSIHPTTCCKVSELKNGKEEQFTSIKRPRLQVITKNKTKEELFHAREKGNKVATQANPPSIPNRSGLRI